MSQKYTIYTSDSTVTPDPAINKKLKDGSSANSFLDSLPGKTIVLESAPSPKPPSLPPNSAKFDKSDLLQQWIVNIDPAAQLSLAVDTTSDQNILSFQASFSAPWSMTFSSTMAALNYVFGPPVPGGKEEAKVPVPGLDEKGLMLYAGLDPSQTSVLQSDVQQLFTWVGLKTILDTIPKTLQSAKATLDPANSQAGHNALWINPSFGSQTTIRLQFQLGDVNALSSILSDSLKGLTFPSANLICKKVVTAAKVPKGPPAAIEKSRILFQVECSVKSESGPAVNLTGCIEFDGGGITLICMVASSDALDGILSWLGERLKDMLEGDLKTTVHSLFNQDDTFKRSKTSPDQPMMSMRRLKLSLLPNDAGKLAISAFSIDIQVAANFGASTDNKPVLFLLSYAWTEDSGLLGTIQGQLWNSKLRI